MIKKWKLLQVKKKNIGHKWYPLEVREYLNQDGKKVEWIVHQEDGVVVVFALTKENEVIVGKQFRPGIHMIEIGLPAGGIEANSSPLQNAKWELEEESGYISKDWKYLGKVARSAGKSTGWQYMYLATNCEKTKQRLGKNEFIDVQLKSIAEFKKLLLEEQIKDMGCAFTGYKALYHLKKL